MTTIDQAKLTTIPKKNVQKRKNVKKRLLGIPVEYGDLEEILFTYKIINKNP